MRPSTPLQTREDYTAAYNNTAAVADAAAVLEQLQARSQAAYAAHACHRDIAYGPGPRQVFDWFPAPAAPTDAAPAQVGGQDGGQVGRQDGGQVGRQDGGQAAPAPLFVFIHGGYWQSRSKADFACIATGPLAAGMQVVLAEHTLAPQARMPAMVAEIGQLLGALQAHPVLGWQRSPGQQAQAPRIILAGHSAGGHLAAMHRSHSAVAGVLAISGLFELAPIARGALNDALQLTAAELAACSPQRHIGQGAPTVVAVGAAELPELQRQSRDYATALQAAGEPASLHRLAGCNHFNILAELENPAGALVALALELSAARA
jgi:acetyl esterase/lipase